MATVYKIIKKSLLTIVIVSAVSLSGCVSDQISPAVVSLPETVSFTNDIVPIFNGSCNVTGCHSQNGVPPNFTPENAWNTLIFFGYVEIDNPANSIVINKITTGSMKEYANEQDRALLLKWIEQGALNDE